jgi:preprotein translocase subunit YajC
MTKLIAQAAIPQGTGAPATGMNSIGGMIGFYALLAGAFYFFFVAPQRRKQKEHDRLLASLQSGDEILTTGGIYGVIANVKDDRFIVRISDNTKIEVAKGFISSVSKRANGEDKKTS